MADYDLTMNINLRCHVFMTQLAVPHLIKTKGGYRYIKVYSHRQAKNIENDTLKHLVYSHYQFILITGHV